MKTLQVFLLLMVCSISMAINLRRLYNSRVTYAEYYTRDMDSSSSGSYSGWRRKRGIWNHRPVHSGVVVTISDGSRWLIHKGNGYGETWDTVITRASYMSSRWTREKCGNVYRHTVNDFMQAGNVNSRYNIVSHNCQHATNRMWNLVQETSC